MDIVDFWGKQVAVWQETNKCGLCWAYGAPLTNARLNTESTEEGKECCVHVFLTEPSFKEVNTVNNTTRLVTSSYCDWSFYIFAVIPSSDGLGTNNYSETKGHNINESLWRTVFYPISECLLCQNLLDFCAILGVDIEISSKGATAVYNWQDANYNGWKIAYTFRIKN